MSDFDLASAKPVEFDLASAKPAGDQPEKSGAASGSLLDEIKRQVGLAGRGIVNGVTALPLMAMDAGVGTRNLVTNLSRGVYPKLNDFNPLPNTGPKSPTDYELPSATFNRSLTQAGVPEPQTTGDKAAQMLVSGMTAGRLPAPQAASQAPANFLNGAQALKNATLQAAQKEGLVVPPSMANPTLGNRIMGGIAGKYKVQQAAQLNNQPIFNQLAARALGQNPDAPLTNGALSSVRQEAADAGYAPLRKFGAMQSDTTFTDKLDALTSTAQGAEKSFPGIKPANSQLDKVLESLKQPNFDSGDAVDAVSHLRSLANDAYGAGQKSVGNAYKGAASALEDLIERNLKDAGKDGEDLLKGFRDARTQMAKTYSVGKALNSETGDVNAPKLGQQLSRNQPLSDELRTVGQFARTFPKASRVPTDGGEPISPLDVYGSVMASRAADSAVPLMLPLTRIGLQKYLLSPAGQARALAQPTSPATRMGIGGFIPTLNSGVFGP